MKKWLIFFFLQGKLLHFEFLIISAVTAFSIMNRRQVDNSANDNLFNFNNQVKSRFQKAEGKY